jgi:CRP-like cAMP-binding protein
MTRLYENIARQVYKAPPELTLWWSLAKSDLFARCPCGAENYYNSISRLVAVPNNRTVHNEILLSLPKSESSVVLSKLQFVSLPVGSVLNECGEAIRIVYFINSGLASVLNVMKSGRFVEVGLCGKEGFVGIPLVAGFKSSPNRVLMQVGGSGFALGVNDLPAALKECPALAKNLSRFGQEMAFQSAQAAACNRLHEMDQRLARWLLMSQDRIGGAFIPLTQEFLAHMLAARRASVTVAASALQRAGLITYSRGLLKVKNRKKLEIACCECYSILVRQSKK